MSKVTFTWKIKKISTLGKGKIYSEIFIFHGYMWKILTYPKGNKEDGYLSLYLSAVDFPSDGNGSVRFKLVLINQSDKSLSLEKELSHNFLQYARSWGSGRFISLERLNSTVGYLLDDTCVFQVRFFTEEKRTHQYGVSMIGTSEKQGVKKRKDERESVRTRDQMSERNVDTHEKTPKESRDEHICYKRDETTFDALFKEIGKIVWRDPIAACSDKEMSSSFSSLMNELSCRSFSEISSKLRDDLCSCLQALCSDNALPSHRVSVIRDFLKQFLDICVSYDSSVTSISTAKEFFGAKSVAMQSLKSLHNSLSGIMESISGVRHEKESLLKRLREAEARESELVEEYGVVGREAKLAKIGWDGLVVKNDAMVELRRKSKSDMANAEALWDTLISPFS